MKKLFSSKIYFRRPPLEDYLTTYNNLLADILIENFSIKYLSSLTINRYEQETHLYQRVEQYIQIRKILTNDNNISIVLQNEDVFLYDMLINEFPNRIYGHKKNTFSTQIKFIYKIILSFIYYQIVAMVCSLIPRKINEYDYIFRTYFDDRNIGPPLREEYLGPLVDDLSKNNKVICVFSLLGTSRYLIKYLACRKTGSFSATLIESFLTPTSVAKAHINFLKSKIILQKKIIYKGVNITPLIQKSLDNEYINRRGLHVFLEYEAAKKVVQLKARKLFMPFENQPWEKVYRIIRDKYNPGLKLAAHQHSSVSLKLLHQFPPINEKKLPVYPDEIFTNGKIFKRLFAEKAHYPSKLLEGAALRMYKHQLNNKFTIKERNNSLSKNIVYAFSYDVSNYSKIVKTLIDVFANSKVTIFLKFHPDYTIDYILSKLDFELPSNFIVATKYSWEEIYNIVDAVLFDDNSIGIEGLINGKNTFYVQLVDPIYYTDRNFYIDRDIIHDESDLITLKEKIENGTYQLEFDRDKIQHYIHFYFTPYIPEIHIPLFTQ